MNKQEQTGNKNSPLSKQPERNYRNQTGPYQKQRQQKFSKTALPSEEAPAKQTKAKIIFANGENQEGFADEGAMERRRRRRRRRQVQRREAESHEGAWRHADNARASQGEGF